MHPTHRINQYMARHDNMPKMRWTVPNYSPLPPKKLKKIVGTLLYYVLAIEKNMLLALGYLAFAQSQTTENTWNKIIWNLNYAATYPDLIIQFHDSSMCLHVHSDTSYLSTLEARSRASGFFFLNDHPSKVKR